jgi:hypothetical protein
MLTEKFWVTAYLLGIIPIVTSYFLIILSFFNRNRRISLIIYGFLEELTLSNGLFHFQRWALPIEFCSDIQIAIGLSNSYQNIGLTYLSDLLHWTSDSPIAIGIN